MNKDDDVIKLPTVQYRTALDNTNRAHANGPQTVTLVPESGCLRWTSLRRSTSCCRP